MHRLFMSDLHLDNPTSSQFLRFNECLTSEAAEVDEIYILGDLVEMWIGDDDDSPLAQALTQSLNHATARCSVFLMHGNRDFLFKDRFAERTGVCLINDMHQPIPTCCSVTATCCARTTRNTKRFVNNYAASNGSRSS